jgi:hypothetical protein
MTISPTQPTASHAATLSAQITSTGPEKRLENRAKTGLPMLLMATLHTV